MKNTDSAVLQRQRKCYVLILLFTALCSGGWAGVFGSKIVAEEGLGSTFFWIASASGLLLTALWVFLAYMYKPLCERWEHEIARFSEESGLKLSDGEMKKVQTFAVCRHENLVSTLKELHSLLTSHLRNVTHETNEAALNLINQLTLIHDAITHLLTTVSSNQQESDRITSGSQTALENNRETMDRLQEYIDRRLREVDHDHQMARELQDQAGIMLEVTRLIESVAKQTLIVATNAKIEATRAGIYGRAFSVIADEVTKLSAQIGSSSKQIIQASEQMGESITEKFKAKLDQKTKADETTLLTGMKDQLITMGESYARLEKFNRETLENINSSSQEIKSKVNDSLMAIQFQDITQQQIDVILKSLVLFEKHLSSETCFVLKGTGEKAYREFDIDQIRKLYVMKKQHDIHNSHHAVQDSPSNGDDGLETDSVTLF